MSEMSETLDNVIRNNIEGLCLPSHIIKVEQKEQKDTIKET